MIVWITEHPWMTLSIIIVLILTVDNIVGNICKTIICNKYIKSQTEMDDIKKIKTPD